MCSSPPYPEEVTDRHRLIQDGTVDLAIKLQPSMADCPGTRVSVAFAVDQFPFRGLQTTSHRQFVAPPFPFSDALDPTGGRVGVQPSHGESIVSVPFSFHTTTSSLPDGRETPDSVRDLPERPATSSVTQPPYPAHTLGRCALQVR